MKDKKITRRDFVKTAAVAGGTAALLASETVPAQKPQTPANAAQKIDRFDLVSRHSPVMRKLDPLSPLSVGNGEFAFTCDITGLQTFPFEYEAKTPLCTMSQWGWHSFPVPADIDLNAFKYTEYDTYGRKVGYATGSTGQTALYNWLRQNPHRLHLGQIGFVHNGADINPSDISNIEQKLDLWTGIITSKFSLHGKPVIVRTAAHNVRDIVAVSVESPLIADRSLKVRFAFPYGSPEMHAADWKSADKHLTTIVDSGGVQAKLKRQLDKDQYTVTVEWRGEAKFAEKGKHNFELGSEGGNKLEFVAAFTATDKVNLLPPATEVFGASESHWNNFWSTGGAVEMAGSKDKRAAELERRVVLSQYLTAIQCSGSMPPQETGLTTNSWYGKFHLEMHWWHGAHFPLWDRLPLLERSLGWYSKVQQSARERAKFQGYTGVRWGKMVGPEGRDSPSPIGPLLIWQQPHPIFYAELVYQTHQDRKTLRQFQSIVNDTAEFMASYAHFDEKNRRYVLGPPVIPAQENHPARETWNPTFELEYWRFGLKIAQKWRERLGMKRIPKWDDVINKLSKLPVKDGVYLAHENCPQTYTERNIDHPSMLGAYGILHGEMADRETMRRTLHKVMKEWTWADTWGWDYPMTAMTAAKLGEGKIAVDALLKETPKNNYLPNGHNYQRPNLPLYLPGNGGLLYAIAMMAGGWQGAPKTNAPGFPTDGSWEVRSDGINYKLLESI